MPREKEDALSKDVKKAQGCQIFFPSTVFFVGDHIDFIATNDKDYCIVVYTGSNMLSIRKDLEREIQNRKAMTEYYCVQQSCSDKMEKLLGGTGQSFFSQKTTGGCKYHHKLD